MAERPCQAPPLPLPLLLPAKVSVPGAQLLTSPLPSVLPPWARPFLLQGPPRGPLRPSPSLAPLAVATGTEAVQWLLLAGGMSLCDRPGLARMPLAVQLLQALGDMVLRTGRGRPRLFAGMSGSQEMGGGVERLWGLGGAG